MNSSNALLISLSLRSHEFQFFDVDFTTSFNLSQLEQDSRISYYIKDLNKKLNTILNTDNLSDSEIETAKSFFFNKSNIDFKYLAYLPESIIDLRQTIFCNIDSIQKIKNLDNEIKSNITSKLYTINDKLTDILNSDNFINFKDLIENQEKFNNNIFKLFQNNEDQEEIKKFIILNYKDNLKNLTSIYDNIYKEIYDLNNDFMIENNYIFEKFIENKVDLKNLALQSYISIIEKKDDLIFSQNLDRYIVIQNDKHFKGIAVFQDRSALIERKDNTFELLATKKQRLDLKDKVISLHLREKYNKNPVICKEFIDIIKLNKDFNMKETFELFDKYMKHIDVFKNYNFNLKEFVINSTPKYYTHKIEAAEDKLTSILLDNSATHIIKNLTSSKNIHLFNEESKKLIKDVLNQKIKIESLNQFIGKKMARFKTTEELNLALTQFINLFGFSYDGVINKANDLNIDIISKENNSVILKIKNFEEALAIGSSSWCICTSENYFNSYVNKDSHQYFVFDFNKEKSSNESLIGITLDKEGNLNTAHLKNDEAIVSDTPEISSFLNIIREKNKKIKQLNLKI